MGSPPHISSCSNVCWKYYHWDLLELHKKSIDCIRAILFWTVFVPLSYVWYKYLAAFITVVSKWSSTSPLFFFWRCFGILGSVHFHMNFGIGMFFIIPARGFWYPNLMLNHCESRNGDRLETLFMEEFHWMSCWIDLDLKCWP